jgi:lipopolysaccharide transport system permease protein
MDLSSPVTEPTPPRGLGTNGIPAPPERTAATAPPPSDARPAQDDLPVTVIEGRRRWSFADLAELWRYRELLFFLTWRDVMVRYKQTVLGAAWAILQPLATMLVFSVFLYRMAAKQSPDAVDYRLFVFAGLIPWTFFGNAIASASQSVVGSGNLVTKIYFPRILIPTGAVAAGLVDFAVAFGMLIAMMVLFGAAPGWGLVLVPFILVGLFMAALGVGMLLSALTVAYRDFRFVVPFLVQLWMFATPCIYLQEDLTLGPRWEAVLPLNPAYGLIANFRASMLGGTIDWYSLCVSGGVTVLLLALGCLYFRRVERGFADII